MTNNPEQDKPKSWVDPYTQRRLLDPETIAALAAQVKQDPNVDFAAIAGACLVELYREQFTIVPNITYQYQKPFKTFQSSFILSPAKKAHGGMRAWNSMATAIDGLNRQSSTFQDGKDLVLAAPPPNKDGRIHISIRNTEEFVKLIRSQHLQVYERAETNLGKGVNYQEGLIKPT